MICAVIDDCITCIFYGSKIGMQCFVSTLMGCTASSRAENAEQAAGAEGASQLERKLHLQQR